MKDYDTQIAGRYAGKDGETDIVVCRGRAPFLDPDVWKAYVRDHPIPMTAKGCTQEEIEESLRFFQSVLGSVGGKKGGRSRSEAKVAAARENGKKGGRPKGSKKKLGREKEEKQRNAMDGRIDVRRIDE